MQNVTLAVKGHILTISIDLSKSFGQSASGKSITIATSGGNVDVQGHAGVKLGLNVYKAAK